jgi:hypothetical protein
LPLCKIYYSSGVSSANQIALLIHISCSPRTVHPDGPCYHDSLSSRPDIPSYLVTLYLDNLYLVTFVLRKDDHLSHWVTMLHTWWQTGNVLKSMIIPKILAKSFKAIVSQWLAHVS